MNSQLSPRIWATLTLPIAGQIEVLKRYEKWKDIVKISGPAGSRLIPGFHDEALRGEWQGHRSSRLGIQHRVIYNVVAHELHVLVIDLTAHDYRRR